MVKDLSRRGFVSTAAAASGMALASTLASPALAQNTPKLSWRLVLDLPEELELIAQVAAVFTKHIFAASDKKFKIEIIPAGKLTKVLQGVEAVSKGSVEMIYTASSHYWRKDPTFAIGGGLPFGLNARQMNAWMYEGGGIELMTEFYAKHNIHAIPAGSTGCQMGGWWRAEIKSRDDLKGKKIRMAGFGAAIVKKLGMVPQNLPGDKAFAALESGAIDAAEWVGPYDDERLGFYKAAKHYYYPGWWESGPMLHVFVNRALWKTLPKPYQAIVSGAGQIANATMLARYDAKNPAALKRILRKGVHLRAFPKPIMEAAFAAADKTYLETAASNANFKRVFDNWKQFRADQYLWSQVAELGMDAFQALAVNRR